jgi:hypothetical protein
MGLLLIWSKSISSSGATSRRRLVHRDQWSIVARTPPFVRQVGSRLDQCRGRAWLLPSQSENRNVQFLDLILRVKQD